MGSLRVSIIIAAYNVEQYIEKAISSALEQSVSDIEVIVVDDASSDRTYSVVQGIVDPRVKLLQNERNKGPSFSRNRAIAEANADWVAILDADDWWAPNRLEILLETGEHEGADIVADDLFLIEEDEELPWNTYFKSRETVLGSINHITVVSTVKMVDDDYGILQPIIRREFLIHHGIRYKDHLRFAEDYVFFLDCLIHSAKMVICPEPYYYYRSRKGSLTNTDFPYAQARYNLLLELLGSEPYNRFNDLTDAISARLHRVELVLKGMHAKELFQRKCLIKAASIVVSNPALLIAYARQMKRSLLPGR